MRNINQIHWNITKKRLHNKISKEYFETLIKALDRYEQSNCMNKDIKNYIKSSAIGGE